MEIKAKEIYKIIQDFRELQENNFYNLPLNIILVLQNNFSIINNLYTITPTNNDDMILIIINFLFFIIILL